MTYTQLREMLGTQQKIADFVGVSQGAVHKWRLNGIPITRQYQLQVMTKGRLRAGGPESKNKKA
jgi:hypothetical protein